MLHPGILDLIVQPFTAADLSMSLLVNRSIINCIICICGLIIVLVGYVLIDNILSIEIIRFDSFIITVFQFIVERN